MGVRAGVAVAIAATVALVRRSRRRRRRNSSQSSTGGRVERQCLDGRSSAHRDHGCGCGGSCSMPMLFLLVVAFVFTRQGEGRTGSGSSRGRVEKREPLGETQADCVCTRGQFKSSDPQTSRPASECSATM